MGVESKVSLTNALYATNFGPLKKLLLTMLSQNILKDENIESHGLKTSYPIHNERATGES